MFSVLFSSYNYGNTTAIYSKIFKLARFCRYIEFLCSKILAEIIVKSIAIISAVL